MKKPEDVKVGDVLYINASYYIDHGEDDICGGAAIVEKVIHTPTPLNPINDWFVNFEGINNSYNLTFLLAEQQKLEEQYGDRLAHGCPEGQSCPDPRMGKIVVPSRKIYLMMVVRGNYRSATSAAPLLELRSRCWGYEFDLKLAQDAIEGNHTDMSELGYYQYAVISELPPGPLSIPTELQWYEFIWNLDTPPRKHDGFRVPEFVAARRITKPAEYEGIIFGAFS